MTTASNYLEGNLTVTERLSVGAITLPAACVSDAQVADGAAIQPKKLGRQHQFSLQQNGTAAAETVSYIVQGATGTIKQIVAGLRGAHVSGATCTIDVKKNNVSVLSSTLTLNDTNTARTAVAATLDVSKVALVDNDWLDIIVTVAAGGGTLGTGLTVQVLMNEDPITT